MKRNSITIICALLTLAVCMLLGVVFGVNDLAIADQQDDVQKAVVSSRN